MIAIQGIALSPGMVPAIIASCGGKDNIEAVSCCLTRLRFQLKNTSLFNIYQAESIPGVSGVIFRDAQPQFVLGLNASSVFSELKKSNFISSDKFRDF